MESPKTGTGRVIIVGSDGSPQSDAALRWAFTVGAQRADTVRAITVYPRDELLPGTSFALQPRGRMPHAEQAITPAEHIAALRAETPGAPEVETVEAAGDPATQLVSATTDADLLVIGAHQHSVVGDLLLGSVSRECVRYAHCPVVVITPEAANRLNPASVG